MTIKISTYGFGKGEEDTKFLSVQFSVAADENGIKFLSALGQFVEAYTQGIPVISAAEVQQTADAMVKGIVEQTPKPRAATKKAPAVVESVTPPLETASPKAPPAASAPPAVTSSAPVSSPIPASTALTAPAVPSALALPVATPHSAPEPVPAGEVFTKYGLPADPAELKHEFNPQQGPISLMQMKSFREVLTAFYARGITTAPDVRAVCLAYSDAPVIARLLQPNPDPEASIEKRIELGLSVLGKKATS